MAGAQISVLPKQGSFLLTEMFEAISGLAFSHHSVTSLL